MIHPTVLAASLATCIGVVVLGGVYFYVRLYLGRAPLDGRIDVSGLGAPVTLRRDAAGIPIVAGASRADVAFGLGFLHAQERYFQMDMSRRAAAGELAELLGETFVTADRKMRQHRFRRRAQQAHAALPPDERALLRSYAAGVREGLRSLRTPPLEYFALRSRPVDWAPEDTLLVVFNLYRALQDGRADQDYNRHLLHAALPRAIAEMLTPEGSSDWDAPLAGPRSPALRIPTSEIFDLRRTPPSRVPGLRLRPAHVAGSNAWAVSGAHTKSGKAIVANDLHLPFAMPGTFYRATLDVAERGPEAALSGLTVPGFPLLLAGTNGEVAWGLANAAIDAVDLVPLDQAGLPADSYRTPDGVKTLGTEVEVIRVRGGADVEATVRESDFGPITRKTRDGVVFAQTWLAHRKGAVNLGWLALERATSVSEALDAANRIAGPTLSVVVGDRRGDVGWTLAGVLPLRAASSEYPRLQSPAVSRVWAANARPFTSGTLGEMFTGGYHVCGARALQIRDDLLTLESADEESMLRIQRDARAQFFVRWHELFLSVLRSAGCADHPRRGEVRDALVSWCGRAAADSAGYRLLRHFRDAVERLVFEPFISIVRARYGQFDLHAVTNQLEAPLWALVTERPAHLLAPWFSDWDDLLMAAARESLDAVPKGTSVRSFVWGAVNRLSMRHPLSEALPLLGRLFDAPSAPLDGDLHMPLAQTSQHGPVCRLVISPGEHASAIGQIAGGQAGNPLSPYYLRGHREWLDGVSSPLDPGSTRYTLTLTPTA